MAEGFHCAFALPINLDQSFTLQQAELLAQNTSLGADGRTRMFSTSIAMAVIGLNEWWLYFEAHPAAQTTSMNQTRHSGMVTLDEVVEGTPRFRSATDLYLVSSKGLQSSYSWIKIGSAPGPGTSSLKTGFGSAAALAWAASVRRRFR